MKKRIAIGTGIFLLVLVGLLAGGSIYMINFSLRPENRGKDMEGSFTFMREKYPQIIPWVDSRQEASCTTRYFYHLSRWYTDACLLCQSHEAHLAYGNYRTWIYRQRYPHVSHRLSV